MTIKTIQGCVSPETAHVVTDYPYGFTLRTSIRYWVETKANYGQRFVSQTLHPKTGKWNKPKAAIYAELVVLFIDEATGYVRHDAITHYSDIDGWEAFASKYELDAHQTETVANVIKVKKFLQAKLERIAA